MVDHNLLSSHNVVFSNSDASTWCYKCESYITNEHLQKLRSMFSAYKFGDQAPVETAWRRSSNYPFALLKAMMLNRPAHTMAINFDASRVIKNLTDQVIYSTTQKENN